VVLRVFKKGTPQEEHLFHIHEAYYERPEDELPYAITADPSCALGETLWGEKGLAWSLQKMMVAMSRPILNYDGIGADAKDKGLPYAFFCEICPMFYTAEEPILFCPVGHGGEAADGGAPDHSPE